MNDLLPLVPYSTRYVEPYGGGASLLLNRRPSPVEVYNDLNKNVVNLFRVMRDPNMYRPFEGMVEATLFSKGEFARALEIQHDFKMDKFDDYWSMILRAWATYVIQNQGISGKHHTTVGNWSRSLIDSQNTERWWKRYEKLAFIHERLKNVQIDCQDALDCIRYWDSDETVFYLDPPYVLSTRDQPYYAVETTDEDHKRLVDLVLTVEGMVVLSGYDHPIYERLVDAGWTIDLYGASASTRVTNGSDSKPRRIESVWRNPQAASQAIQVPLPLFGEL